MQVPSTKSLELDEIQIDKSFLYIKNKRSPSIQLWRTPAFTGVH